MKISGSKKYLVTAYHVLSQHIIEKEDFIELELYNNEKIKLKLKDRFIKYFPLPKDITLVEITNNDKVLKDIKFLYYDLDYILGYNIYMDGFVFTIEHIFNQDASCATGKIIDINKFEFIHNINTDHGASGSPIMLLNNNINKIRVIGIHKSKDSLNNGNYGTFIGEIFDEEMKGIRSDNKIIVKFLSTDQRINIPFVCKKTRKFSHLEKKLYKEFPELKNRKIYFLAEGNIINRKASLIENKIKNDSGIIIIYHDDS